MSIDVNVQNDLVIVTESSEDITVNVSNAAGPAGVGVPVGGTTGQVLKKFTNTNYDTYWAADASGLTSVGLSMPSAFAVSNSPLTSNGTIAVTGAGTASQYIRGDGQLANFPDNGGGGSSVNYYLNGSVNQGTFGGDTYYEMSKTPILGAGTNFTRTNAQGNGYIASFITDAGDPSLLNIPGGNWNVQFYFQANSNAGNPEFYAELYKVDASNNFTLVGSGSTNPEGITNGTTIDQYYTAIPVPQTSLLVTDRLAIRIYVIPAGRTITLHTENSNLCEVITTFSTGLNALNGLTAQVQYFATGTSGTDFAISSATDTHTFNLPTASATNRGALSSADWSTFSGKVGGSGATGQVAYWNGTSSQTGSNNLFWDAANSRLGIGTNTPSKTLDVNGLTNLKSLGASYNPILIVENTGTASDANKNVALFIGARGNSSIIDDNTNIGIIQKSNIVGNFGLVNFFNASVNLSAFLGAEYNNHGATNNANLIFGTATTIKAKLFNTGNLVLQNGGTFSDGGQRLQVQGDAFIKGSGATSATNALLVQDSSGNNLLRVLNNGFVRYGSNLNGPFISADGSNTGSLLFYTSGGSNATGAFVFRGDIAANTTGNNICLNISQAFSPSSGTANYSLFSISSTINQTGGANGITRGLYVNPTLTAAADWRSIEWSNNSGWGLYGAGTANNYLNGNLWVGTTSATGYKLGVSGATLLNGLVVFGTYGTGVGMYWDNANNSFGIGNTSPSAKIDVLGINLVNVKVKSNTNSGASIYQAANDLNNTNEFGMWGSTRGAFGAINSGDGFLYSNVSLALTSGVDMKFGTGATPNERMRLTAAGRLLLGTTTESTFLLDVNGTARVSDNLTVSKNQNAATVLQISNTTSGASANSYLEIKSSNGSGFVAKFSASTTPYKFISGNDFYMTNGGTSGDLAILNDNATGVIKLGAGGSSTAHMTIKANGRINMSSLPTSPAGLSAGDIWNDGGTLKIV